MSGLLRFFCDRGCLRVALCCSMVDRLDLLWWVMLVVVVAFCEGSVRDFSSNLPLGILDFHVNDLMLWMW